MLPPLFLLLLVLTILAVSEETIDNALRYSLKTNEMDDSLRAEFFTCALSCIERPSSSCACIEKFNSFVNFNCALSFYGCASGCLGQESTDAELNSCRESCYADVEKCDKEAESTEDAFFRPKFDTAHRMIKPHHKSPDMESISDLRSLDSTALSKICSLKCSRQGDKCQSACIQSSLRVSDLSAGGLKDDDDCTNNCYSSCAGSKAASYGCLICRRICGIGTL